MCHTVMYIFVFINLLEIDQIRMTRMGEGGGGWGGE